MNKSKYIKHAREKEREKERDLWRYSPNEEINEAGRARGRGPCAHSNPI